MLLGGKKLAGTRARKQFYLAIDTELVVQNGCRLFRTDEAIISPDWISNECLVCAYGLPEPRVRLGQPPIRVDQERVQCKDEESQGQRHPES